MSQGVVTYNVVIGFDTEDGRIKPGMTATASIITDVKQNVLMIPNSAVKFLSTGQAGVSGANYVDVPDSSLGSSQLTANTAGVILDALPRQQSIEIGTANDSFTEIITGLQEGDIVITRTITTGSTTQTTTQGNSLFPTGGARGTGAGGFRTQIR